MAIANPEGNPSTHSGSISDERVKFVFDSTKSGYNYQVEELQKTKCLKERIIKIELEGGDADKTSEEEKIVKGYSLRSNNYLI